MFQLINPIYLLKFMKKYLIKVLCVGILFQLSTTLSAQQFKVLVLTKTEGFQHGSIPEATLAIKKLAERHAFTVEVATGSNAFNDKNLEQYSAVIFLLTTGNILDSTQKKAMEKFIRSGKGFVGVHSASDTEYGWDWYTKLVGMMFKIHPLQQTAYLDVVNSNFPGMERFPKRLLWTDEWYEFQERKVDDLKLLVTVDEKTYNPVAKWGPGKEGKGMGAMHPISWYHNYDGGRAFYTALGHIPSIYSDQTFLDHLYGGIYWAATGKGL